MTEQSRSPCLMWCPMNVCSKYPRYVHRVWTFLTFSCGNNDFFVRISPVSLGRPATMPFSRPATKSFMAAVTRGLTPSTAPMYDRKLGTRVIGHTILSNALSPSCLSLSSIACFRLLLGLQNFLGSSPNFLFVSHITSLDSFSCGKTKSPHLVKAVERGRS